MLSRRTKNNIKFLITTKIKSRLYPRLPVKPPANFRLCAGKYYKDFRKKQIYKKIITLNFQELSYYEYLSSFEAEGIYSEKKIIDKIEDQQKFKPEINHINLLWKSLMKNSFGFFPGPSTHVSHNLETDWSHGIDLDYEFNNENFLLFADDSMSMQLDKKWRRLLENIEISLDELVSLYKKRNNIDAPKFFYE